jgi:CBS domain-containing protein
MRNQRQLIIVVVVVLLGTGAFLLSDIRNANTQSSENVNKSQQNRDDSDKNFPLVSLETSESVSNVDEKRRKRNEKYDKWNWVKPNISNEATGSKIVSDWEVGLPALPVKESDAILVGVVTSTDAFLSNNKTGIYSEFTIQVSSLIKDNQTNPINSGKGVTTQRVGGRVKYPSGRILKYWVSGQRMPGLNGKYVFFLAYDNQTELYRIITAYEVSSGKILPLDTFNKFKVYEGVDEVQFMNELRNTLLSKTNSQEEKGTP